MAEVKHPSILNNLEDDQDYVSLKASVNDAQLRGRRIDEILGDSVIVAKLLKFIGSRSEVFASDPKFQSSLIQTAANNSQDENLKPKDRAVWAKIGLEAMKVNMAQAEMALRVLGLIGGVKSEVGVSVNINQVIAEKALSIVDPVYGGHSRTEEEQGALNGIARRLFDSSSQPVAQVKKDSRSEPIGTEEDSGRRQVLDAKLLDRPE